MNENDQLNSLFAGAVPERLNEIMKLVEAHSAQFRRIEDRTGFNLDAGAFGAIQFTQRSLEQLWFFGFAGLFALHRYAGIAYLVVSHGLIFDLHEIEALPGQEDEDKKFSSLISSIEALNGAQSWLDFAWPEEIPKPIGRPDHPELAAVFDLVLMATAYVFLHELKHVIFAAEGNAPSDPVQEEMQCDAFAKEMMLGKVGEYSVTSGYPQDKVIMKRSAGISLAAAFLAVATPVDILAGSLSHPAVHKRWAVTLGESDLAENDYYWLYFACLAIAILRHRDISFPAQMVESYKNLALSAIHALERHG